MDILVLNCISNNWGIQKVLSRMQLGVYLVIDNYVYLASDALPLCQILEQSDNWLW